MLSTASLLIMVSFILIAIAVIFLFINGVIKAKKGYFDLIHQLAGLLAGILYLVGSFIIFLDGLEWNKFKTELLIVLVALLLSFGSFFLAKYKKQMLTHYFMVFVLVIVVMIMHLKWSYVI